MQKEYVIQFYKTVNKLLCNLSFAGQYMKTHYLHVAVGFWIVLLFIAVPCDLQSMHVEK